MSLITKTYTFSNGATVYASEHNSNNDTIYSDYNGNITNANVSASAAIADSKLAQITTASKVSGASITLLSSVPSGAEALPSVNGGTGLSSFVIGQLLAASTTSVITGLGGGTTGLFLQGQTGALPAYSDIFSSIKDYGTSASSSTVRKATAIKVAYGQFAFGANGSQAISNLSFSSSSTYAVSISSGYGVSTNEDIRVSYDSGAQFTLYNDINRACTVGWIAIGT